MSENIMGYILVTNISDISNMAINFGGNARDKDNEK